MTFYNSVKIFNISLENEDIVSGYLTKTNDYIHLYLNVDFENLKSMNIYYMDNGEKKYLFKASHKTSIFITDYIDYQEYFDFSKFNEYINNLYIEIELEGEIKAEELIFTRIYSNKNVFFNSDRGFTPYEDRVSTVGNKDYKSKIEMLNQIYNGESKSIKYEDVNYDVFCFEDSIIVEYELKNDKVHINYSIFKHDFIYKMINEKLIYNENVTNTDNLEVLNDYNLIKNIIDYLIELD